MKGCNLEDNATYCRARVVNNTIYHFGSNLGVEIFLEKREHQRKGKIKNI